MKIVFTDLDGTLLQSEEGEPSKASVETLKRLEAAGWHVVVATGRTAYSASAGLQGVENIRFFPGVYSQGLIVYGPGGENDIVFEQLLDKTVLRSIVKFWRNHPDRDLFAPVAYVGSDMYCLELNELARSINDYREKVPIAVGTDAEALQALRVNKMIFMCKDKEAKLRFRGELEEALGDSVETMSAEPEIFEALPKGASKGRGVQLLAERLGVDLKDCIAIGDGENDIDMLKLVGTSLAMGNASDHVKSAAKRTVKSLKEDGWSVAMEALLAESCAVPAEQVTGG